MAENERAEYLECPFCGKDDIKYGAVVCGGFQAEIHYGRAWVKLFVGGAILIFIGIYGLVKGFIVVSAVIIGTGAVCLVSARKDSEDHEPRFVRDF
ncbi:hypothetical protein [uncultured Campylobacter sp.]|uniref:hypothetical protein n=1 Tax=uncultured Campylobacter sp. TaxID=218934 RepID=UPI0026059938|nr:hypothetical protein [uncultured Campylobacter sp.]